MPVRIMSDAELTKFQILRDVDHERMPVRAAAQVLGLTERQVWRLLKAYRLRGADGLISRKRGRPSNRKTPDDVRLAALALIQANAMPTSVQPWRPRSSANSTTFAISPARRCGPGWSPTASGRPAGSVAAECSSAALPARLSRRAGPDRRLRAPLVRGSRPQVHPAGVHRRCDQPADAPAVRPDRVDLFLFLGRHEPIFETHGKPIAFYSDKHSVFRVNRAAGATTDGMTQFGRALHDLSIEIICANSSQAKGRVERANKTLQDRLVKELRLAGDQHHRRRQRLPPQISRRLQRPFRQARRQPQGSAQTHDQPR